MSTETTGNIVDTLAHIDPELLRTYGLMAFFGVLTLKQKLWIKERDNNDCQGRTVMMSHRCLHDELQVHHIAPQLHSYDQGATEIDVDAPENLITLCSVAHVDSRGDNPNAIHNDQYAVMCEYRQGNKNAFRDMQDRRAELMRQGQQYWNSRYDRGMLAYARDATRKFVQKKGPYPLRKRNQE